MTDGTLAVRRRDPKASEATNTESIQTSLKSGAYEYFAEMESIFGKGHIKKKGKDLPAVVGPVDEVKIESRRKDKLKTFDKYLKVFKYGAALDSGIQKVSSPQPGRRSGVDLTWLFYSSPILHGTNRQNTIWTKIMS
jgi:U3 small nucleolar RNA-associated protein 15